MLHAVITLILRPCFPIVSKFFLRFSVSEPPQFHVRRFGRFVYYFLLVNPTAVELYVWMGVLDCGHHISINVLRNGIIFLAVMYNAAISASAADAITVLMIWAIVKTGPLSFGFGSFSENIYVHLIGSWILTR